MHEFNRNRQSKVCEVAFLTSIFCCVILAIVAVIVRNLILVLPGCTMILLYYIVVLPITEHLPKDFNYTVEVQENFLIFSWSDYDKRAVCTSLTDYTVANNNIIIYDGNSVITVPYCKELIEFLEGL